LKENQFFSKDYTGVLKGLCCLIVVYVHVIEGRGNTLQDAIGSFAYCCVTLFFLVSAYGMMLSAERKKEYLSHFWRNRLLSLLIPAFLINVVNFAKAATLLGKVEFDRIFFFSGYVAILLQWCVWFYIVMMCQRKWFAENRTLADGLLIGGVVASSLISYFAVDNPINTSKLFGWPYERMGLVWGVLLYRYFDKVVAWMDTKRGMKVIALTVLGLVLGVAYLKFKVVYFWGAYLLKVVLGFTLILLLFTLTSNRQFGNRVSLWLGDVSYEVYLSHGLVMGVLAILLPPTVNSGLFILLTVATTLCLSTLVHAVAKPIVNSLRKK
jgi:peptidoglycan/LPS O-acetylase OafA/YrhL